MTYTIWKPSPSDKDIIREFAGDAVGYHPNSLRIEVGERYNTDKDDNFMSMNIALLTTHPYWEDTDLAGLQPWGTFAKGVPALPGGYVVCDFYIYRKSDGELLTNVNCFVMPVDGELKVVRMEDTNFNVRFYNNVSFIDDKRVI